LTLAGLRDENKKRTYEVPIMLTGRIDRALEALISCREHVPLLRDLYGSGSPERAALDAVLDRVRLADDLLTAGTSRRSASRCEQP